MIKIILSVMFILLAAMFSASMDTVAFHRGGWFARHWKGKPFAKFFDISQQGKFFWRSKLPIDGIHIFKGAMVCFYIASVALWLPWPIISFVAIGVFYVLVFNLFWNKIFK